MSDEFYWVAVAVVSVLSAARITRLATVDKFPPMVWVRDFYERITDTPRLVGWQLLFFCGYCFGFWAALGVVLWGWLSDFHEPWWVANGILAAAYLAAIVMAYDGDMNDEDHIVIEDATRDTDEAV